MSMVTRCPTCATVFRVTLQQLQAHQGQVRCGRCTTVFDGFAALATLPDQQPEEPAAKVASARAIGDAREELRLDAADILEPVLRTGARHE